jgi:serine/threonine protein kinase
MEIDMVGSMVSHYAILEKLGGGGMGVVYRAQDTRLDRPVALKFLPPDLTRDLEAKQRFVHEAKAASALQHNNICTVHDIDESTDGQLFIVMDFYEGETLKKKIERGPLKVEEAVDIVMQVAQGLTKAHELGIVHRDIKPANVMVT